MRKPRGYSFLQGIKEGTSGRGTCILVSSEGALLSRPGMAVRNADTELNLLILGRVGRQHRWKLGICVMGCGIAFNHSPLYAERHGF
jgi:hypothetical protein